MAKNDFHIVIKDILNYLYTNLLKGQYIDINNFNSKLFDINDNYFNYILNTLIDYKFIIGAKKLVKNNDRFDNVELTKGFMIAPLGIEYLNNNKIMHIIESELYNGIDNGEIFSFK